MALLIGFFLTKKKFDDNPTFFVLCILSVILCLYMIYKMTRKLQYKGPEIRFTPTDLELNDNGKMVAFLWQQVIDWEIKKDGRNEYLIINTTDGKKTMSIDWFDKKPDEINLLMQQYKQ